MKVYDAGSLTERGPGRSQRRGQDAARVHHAVRRRHAVNGMGRVDDGTTDDRLRRRRNRPQAHPLGQRWPSPSGTSTRSISSTRPGIGNFFSEPQGGAPRLRLRPRRGGWRLGRPGHDREDLGARRGVRPAAHRRAQPPRPGARQPRPVARVAARNVRPVGRPGPDADRRGEVVPRGGGPGGMKAYVYEGDGSGTMRRSRCRRTSRPGHGRARGPDRDGRRGRRPVDGEVLRGRHADHRGAGRRLRAAVLGRRVFPVFCTSAAQNVGSQSLLDAILAYVPSPAEVPVLKGEEGRRGPRDHPRPSRRPTPRSSGRPWPTPSPAASRCSG
jgi:hypothetical protein